MSAFTIIGYCYPIAITETGIGLVAMSAKAVREYDGKEVLRRWLQASDLGKYAPDARRVLCNASSPPLTLANMTVGTPDFVAPEALEMDREPDGRADLYAVRCGPIRIAV